MTTPMQRYLCLAVIKSNEVRQPIRSRHSWSWHNAVVWGVCLLFCALFWGLVAVGVRHVASVSQGIVTPADGVKIVIMESQQALPPETDREPEYFKDWRKP